MFITREARAAATAAEEDPFETYPPPFDLTSDMLLLGATCAVAPLQAVFPALPFVSLGGRALLGIWFARIMEIRCGQGGRRRIEADESPAGVPYDELNVAALLRNRRLFVPGIYASSHLSLRLGHRYGMPKKWTNMDYRASGREVRSHAVVENARSFVTARSLPGGRLVGTGLARTLPWWSWRVDFPSGSWIESLIESGGGARLLWVKEGELTLDEPWLPRAVTLRGPALHIPRQRMMLPEPATEGGGA